jgi:hypothetical protein
MKGNGNGGSLQDTNTNSIYYGTTNTIAPNRADSVESPMPGLWKLCLSIYIIDETAPNRQRSYTNEEGRPTERVTPMDERQR